MVHNYRKLIKEKCTDSNQHKVSQKISVKLKIYNLLFKEWKVKYLKSSLKVTNQLKCNANDHLILKWHKNSLIIVLCILNRLLIKEKLHELQAFSNQVKRKKHIMLTWKIFEKLKKKQKPMFQIKNLKVKKKWKISSLTH